jgi:hypothetical protein
MTESEAVRIMHDLAARYGVPPLGEGEFTTALFADERGIPYNAASTIIKRALQDGALEKVGSRRMPTGHTATAYRAVK